MRRHELLEGLHKLVQPRTYLEIGVQTGRSLRYSRSCTIAVDPAFHLINEVLCDLHLVRATSDEFFARHRPLAHFPFPAADMAFIDGMHLAEYALRDLINVERHTLPTSVIVLDDMLPRHVDEAGRGRDAARTRGSAWAGDVYKVVATLRELRPDLVCLEVDTQPTGTVIILFPDADSTVLPAAYDELVEQSSCRTRRRSPTTSSDELVPSARRTCSTRPSGRSFGASVSGTGSRHARVCARNSTGSAPACLRDRSPQQTTRSTADCSSIAICSFRRHEGRALGRPPCLRGPPGAAGGSVAPPAVAVQ